MSMKIIEVKRKIITQIRNREPAKALKLFYRYFTLEKPAEIEFIKNVFVEFNRFDFPKENYEFLKSIKIWYPDDKEFDEIYNNSIETYVSKLILQANSIRFQRIDKQKRLEDSLRKADNMTRQKMETENAKQLSALNEKSIELYKSAIKLSPKNLIAYKGWYDCCVIAKNYEDAEKVLKKINLIKDEEKKAEELKNPKIEEKVEINHIDYYSIYEKLLNENKFNEVIQKVDELKKTNYFPSELLLLKAKALASIKQFKDSEKTLYEAERYFPDFNLFKQTVEDINEIKYKLFSKAGNVFLQKGLNLGYPLGQENFLKAKYCLLKAIAINSNNIDILDQAYTALKYLGEDKEAFDIKAIIYSIKSDFVTSYDSKYNQSLCFIATYAFYDQPNIVNEFRWFRREYLLNTKFGRRLNSLYIVISSKITKCLLNKNSFRFFFKIFLYFPLLIIKFLKYINNRFFYEN